MTQPDDVLRSLIEAEAESITPPPASKVATWARVSKSIIDGAVPPIDLPPSATPTVLAATSKAGWWIVGVIVFGVGAGVWSGRSPSAPAEPPPAVAVAPIIERAAPVFTANATLTAEPKIPAAQPTRRRAVRRSPEPRQNLTEELAILRRVQTALTKGEPKVARAAVLEHQRRFPRGAVVEERRALDVLVLCALGRTQDAKRAAAHFARTYPKSPQLDRVQQACRSTD